MSPEDFDKGIASGVESPRSLYVTSAKNSVIYEALRELNTLCLRFNPSDSAAAQLNASLEFTRANLSEILGNWSENNSAFPLPNSSAYKAFKRTFTNICLALIKLGCYEDAYYFLSVALIVGINDLDHLLIINPILTGAKDTLTLAGALELYLAATKSVEIECGKAFSGCAEYHLLKRTEAQYILYAMRIWRQLHRRYIEMSKQFKDDMAVAMLTENDIDEFDKLTTQYMKYSRWLLSRASYVMGQVSSSKDGVRKILDETDVDDIWYVLNAMLNRHIASNQWSEA